MKHTSVKQLVLAAVALIASSVLGACASRSGGGMPTAMHTDTARYIGVYSGPQGQVVKINKSHDGFVLDITRDGKTSHHDAYVLGIGGVDVWEITLDSSSSSGDANSPPSVPTYLYGRVDPITNGFEFRRLRTDWLEQQARTMPDSAFGRTPQIAEGTGAIVVKHPAAMEGLLRRAVKDPAAFGEPEAFRLMK